MLPLYLLCSSERSVHNKDHRGQNRNTACVTESDRERRVRVGHLHDGGDYPQRRDRYRRKSIQGMRQPVEGGYPGFRDKHSKQRF